MNVLIIDGQGGGVGRLLVERIAGQFQDANIIACGTNSMATANMLKGAKISGATGENAVVYNARRADVIVGPVGIVMANAMLGEITPVMAAAVTDSDARIILIPMNRCQTKIVGVQEKKISEYVDEVIEMMKTDTQQACD
ncbi:MAG: DUF3842 family protein [Lachnospiraceae bacterium]|nr:DUF3842 family protein [Lachnospiraceae bacterium]